MAITLKKIRSDVTNFLEVRRAFQQLQLNIETVNEGVTTTGMTGAIEIDFLSSVALNTSACTLSAVTSTLTINVADGLVISSAIT